MELSEITTSVIRSRSYLIELPMEIHLRIRNQLLSDPDVDLGQLRSLRLVCKTFDNIWLPSVMANIVLLPTNLAHPPYHSLVQYLQRLVHRKGNNIANCTTLTIRNWHCLDTELDRFSTDIRQLWGEGLAMTLIWILFVIATHFIVVLVSLIFFILLCLVQPHKIPYHMNTILNARRARAHLASLPRKLDIPNIRCCRRVSIELTQTKQCNIDDRLFIDSRERDWAMDHSTKILLSLPQLTELELGISLYTDLEYLVRHLTPLTGLRKLTLLRATVTSFHTRSLRALIARNKNLTHLNYDLRPDVPQDLSELFRDVPTDKPLRLDHVSLNGTCTNFEALAPHVRQSLSCFEYHSGPRNLWCVPFAGSKVFPRTIKVESLDQDLVAFAKCHPGIVSLTITTSRVPHSTTPQGLGLFQVLTEHHAETLQYLSLNTKLLAVLFENMENEASFLQCASNLRELVLETDAKLADYQNSALSIHNEQLIFPVIALLNRSLTVAIKSQDKGIFLLCLKFCRDSENPLIRDLVRRIAYEKGSSQFKV